jgi:rRNA maturation protein Nop10
MGSTTMNGLTALAQAVEGQEIVTAMYAEIHATKDPSINQTNNGSDTLTAAGLVDGDSVHCIPRYSGADGFKRQRQEEKLRIAVTKRKGLAAGDTNAVYYRALNTKTKTNLPTLYAAGNNTNLVDNANSGGLVAGRPWT